MWEQAELEHPLWQHLLHQHRVVEILQQQRQFQKQPQHQQPQLQLQLQPQQLFFFSLKIFSLSDKIEPDKTMHKKSED